MDCHGLSGIGRLWSKPLGLLFVSFDAAHVPHDMQNVSMSCAIEVHQKCKGSGNLSTILAQKSM